MKVDQNKLGVELRVTALGEKQSAKEEFVKATAKSLTTLEVIGLAVLIMFPQGLFRDTLTEFVNRNEKVD